MHLVVTPDNTGYLMHCVVTPDNTGNTAQLIINVEDVNDNAPQFLHSKYEAHLLENKLEFESLLVIEARDLDLNEFRIEEGHRDTPSLKDRSLF
uniref:Cadherin domain-containing protein n=1 Tax=Timema poppense TaxID=170557 RepID=A0A7R9CV64_TIMPO|nr:unnamed protein product [Timema poppensis]